MFIVETINVSKMNIHDFWFWVFLRDCLLNAMLPRVGHFGFIFHKLSDKLQPPSFSSMSDRESDVILKAILS